jgi:hypothetical protein
MFELFVGQPNVRNRGSALALSLLQDAVDD